MVSINVIIPAFNASAVIEPTLQAVLRQQVPADVQLSVTVVDDGSSDNTAARVKTAFGEQVAVLSLPANGGRGNAINAGVDAAAADYVIILDADCIPMDDQAIVRFVRYFRDGAVVVAGQATSQAMDFWGRYIRDANARRAQLGGVLQMTTPFCGIQRELFVAAGGFLPDYRHYGFEDRDLLLRLQAAAGTDAGFVVAADIAASHEDVMSGAVVLRKMQEAARHTAPVFMREYPGAYFKTSFARMDAATTRGLNTILLMLLQPLLWLLRPWIDPLLDAAWVPYACKHLLLRAGSALAYFAGSRQRYAPRLLVLSSTYPRHAADTVPAFVHQLCCELSHRFEVHVLVPHDAGARLHEVLDGVHVHRFMYALPALEQLAYRGGVLENLKQQRWRYALLPGFVFMQAVAMMWLMCRYRVVAVHAHWLIPQGWVAAMVTRVPGFRRPLLVTSHGADLFALQGGQLARMKRWVLRNARAVTVVSHVMREQVLAWGIDPARVHVAPMGVDLQQRFVPAAGTRHGLVFVGRLAEKKGMDVLLDALALLKEQGNEPAVTVVGDGAQRDALRQQAARLGLDHITWAGAVAPAAVPGYFQRAAIAVVPSKVAADGDQEGLGLVCVEAMGCGCALVASDLPAIRDVVTHERTGLCVPADDPAALASALGRLLADAGLRESLAAAGRQAVCQQFDWPAAGRRYRDVLDSIVA